MKVRSSHDDVKNGLNFENSNSVTDVDSVSRRQKANRSENVVKNFNFRKKKSSDQASEILVHLRNTETRNKKLWSRLFQFARMLFNDFA